MATRKEHLEKADKLLARAESAEVHASHEAAKRHRDAAKAHAELAEAMRPTRPSRPIFGTTRISRKGQGR